MLTPQANTNLWCVRRVKKSEFPEGFVRRSVRTVRYRGAGALAVVLAVGALRRARIQPGALPRRRRALCRDHAARGAEVARGSEAVFVPELHVVVSAGLVQRAAVAVAAPFQQLLRGVAPRVHRGVHLREARFSTRAVVDVLDRVVLAVAGDELQFLPNGAAFRRRGAVSRATVAGHAEGLNPGVGDGGVGEGRDDITRWSPATGLTAERNKCPLDYLKV